MPLRRLLAVALPVVVLAACSDDTGVSPLEPTRGLAGKWVLGYSPESRPGIAELRIRLPADTITIIPELHAMWSRETVTAAGPGRFYEELVLSSAGPVVFVSYAPCAVCFAVAADRQAAVPDAPTRLSTIPGPTFRLVRETRDRFRLDPMPHMSMVSTWYYRVPEMRLEN